MEATCRTELVKQGESLSWSPRRSLHVVDVILSSSQPSDASRDDSGEPQDALGGARPTGVQRAFHYVPRALGNARRMGRRARENTGIMRKTRRKRTRGESGTQPQDKATGNRSLTSPLGGRWPRGGSSTPLCNPCISEGPSPCPMTQDSLRLATFPRSHFGGRLFRLDVLTTFWKK